MTLFLDAVNNLSGGCSRFQVKGDDLYENITWLEGATAQPTKEEVEASLKTPMHYEKEVEHE